MTLKTRSCRRRGLAEFPDAGHDIAGSQASRSNWPTWSMPDAARSWSSWSREGTVRAFHLASDIDPTYATRFRNRPCNGVSKPCVIACTVTPQEVAVKYSNPTGILKPCRVRVQFAYDHGQGTPEKPRMNMDRRIKLHGPEAFEGMRKAGQLGRRNPGHDRPFR